MITKKQRKQKTILLVNNKGKTIRLPASASIGDLYRMGAKQIEIAPKDSPLRKGWWAVR